MSTTLRLTHHTGYSYKGGAVASYNEARMQPQSNPDQTVLHTKVEVTPNSWSMTWQDYWGTLVTSFEVHERHPELSVEATSTVTVNRHAVEREGLSWEQMAAPEVRDEWQEMLGVDDRVDPGEELGGIAAALAEQAETPAHLVDALGATLRDRLTQERGGSVSSRARDAWARGSGVCQDFAHLAIGALRQHGVPARYVAGYTLAQTDPEVGQTYPGEAHAWLEWWDGAWVPFDPSSGDGPDDFDIEVGVGRDYRDVLPLSGIFTGSPGSTMFTGVEVTRLA